MIRTISISVLLLILSGCQFSMDYSIQDRNTRVQNFINKQLESNKFPGIQYVVLNQDTVLFSYCGGWSDISGQKQMQPDVTMMIYSMSKTFTAAAVLQLVEHGKISLDDSVTKYLDNVPYGRKVKIRHLLSQTSGIPNPMPLSWVHLSSEHSDYDEIAALQKILDGNSQLNFTPGERYAYSNISYWLLGRVIEEVSGLRYDEYMRQNIFNRLGIPPNEIDYVIPSPEHHSKGYLPKWSYFNFFKSFLVDSKFIGEYEESWLHINNHYLNGPSFGGIIGTARAVGIFLQDQLQDSSRLFAKATKILFYKQQRDNYGQPIEMTLGWHIGMSDSTQYFFKEGGGAGFHCEMRIYPKYNVASVVIANNSSFDAGNFLNIADKEFLIK